LYFTDIRYQVAEIEQISGNRQALIWVVCQMQSAQFLSSATCSLLNQRKAF
jgi:hypothetical protein